MKITSDRKRFDYKWITVALCFLMVMISLGFGSSTKSLFPDEIAKALGVERSLVSIGESCRYIATAIVNLFFGALVAKFGSKKLILAGILSLSFAMVIYSVANNLALIYIAGTLLGIGFSFTTTTMVGYVVGVWCSENKGTIMGAVLAANGIGGAIAIQLAGGLIDPDTVGSYRAAYRMIAIVFAALFTVMLLLFRDKPQNAETAVAKKSKKRGQDWVGIEFSSAVRKFYFWGALVCIFFSGFIIQGTYGIVAMHLKDVGIDYGAVKGLLSFSSLILATAKFMTGFVYDKKGLRIASGFCTVIAIATTFLLAFVKGDSTGFVLAVAYSAISPFAMPLETIMLPLFASELFGNKCFAKTVGVFTAACTAGFAIGAPFGNLCYDIFGDYNVAFITFSCLMLFVTVAMQFVVRAAHKDRENIIALSELEEKLTEASET